MTTITQTDATWQEDATVIGLVSLAHASSHFAHLLLPLMFPKFIETFGFSYSELGLLMSVFFVVSGVGQASAGFLVDRLGASAKWQSDHGKGEKSGACHGFGPLLRCLARPCHAITLEI